MLKAIDIIKTLSLFAVLVLVGCATPPVVVSDSQLNWLEVKYMPISPDAKPCRISLIGVGSIEYKEGTSPQVASSFAVNTEDAGWQDVYQESLGVQPAVLRSWLQRFADAGVMTENARVNAAKELQKKADRAFITARINGKKAVCITTGESLIKVVRDLIRSIKQHTVEDVE